MDPVLIVILTVLDAMIHLVVIYVKQDMYIKNQIVNLNAILLTMQTKVIIVDLVDFTVTTAKMKIGVTFVNNIGIGKTEDVLIHVHQDIIMLISI